MRANEPFDGALVHELIAELEAKIRSNRVGEVHEAINALGFADIPRVHAAKMANLALRSGALFWAIRLLNPIVRSNSAGVKASAEELAEYGFALNRIGAQAEAERVLTEIANQPLPRVQVYLAAIRANAWDYEGAKTCFERYLLFTELTPYERRIGKLNLANALIGTGESYDEAARLLAELREELAKEENKLLLGNSIELSAQLAVKRGEHEECAKWIEEGRRIFPGVDSIFSLFFLKWQNISKMKRGLGDSHQLMAEVRSEAERLQHHETIREADFYLALETKDENLFNKVYFGTPWPNYRERLLKMKPEGVMLWSHFDHSPSGKSSTMLQVNALGATAGETKTKSGQLLHRMLVALTSDLYRPLWVAAAFTQLFPDEYYQPESGPKRVHQAVFRLRKWFDEAGLPLDLEDKNGRYSLIWRDACTLRLERGDGRVATSADEALYLKIVDKFAGAPDFGSQEIAKLLEV